MAAGERADGQRLRAGEQARDLAGGLQLRIDDHGKTQLLAQVRQLLAVVGIAHARDGRQIAARLLGDRAAQQVQLVRARHRNDEVGLLQPRLFKHAQARAVAADAHHVEDLGRIADDALARVHHGNIMSLADEPLGQRMPHLAAADDDDVQAGRLLFCWIDQHVASSVMQCPIRAPTHFRL